MNIKISVLIKYIFFVNHSYSKSVSRFVYLIFMEYQTDPLKLGGYG
jgi:hypothetical protein